MLTREIEELKDRFVEQLSPLQVYLFGSFADGTDREDSDFDFYMVVDDDSPSPMDLAAETYKAIRHVRTRPVDILIGKRFLWYNYPDMFSPGNRPQAADREEKRDGI